MEGDPSTPADRLRALPPAHALLDSAPGRALASALTAAGARDVVRHVLATLRDELTSGDAAEDRTVLTDRALVAIERAAKTARRPRLKRVINATGVIVHTNLGRAPLGEAVAAHVAHVCQGYATLEYDVESGHRDHRDRLVSQLCAVLVGAEDALVVNNNAAAVLLTATALGAGREVVVSRGELVEIGGGFRIPEILASCGARLVEVGTTNRTRLADFERAITDRTAVLLRVHRSNFAMSGYTAEVALSDLVALGHARGIRVVEDLGSGALVNPTRYGLCAEPTVPESIAAGADLVMFSGDKLLGGPQAGILVGTRAVIEQLRVHPLARALRPGRLVFAALEATLRIHAEGRAAEAIPVVAMMAESPQSVRARAETLRDTTVSELGGAALSVAAISVTEMEGRVGGGSMPTARVASWGVCVRPLVGGVVAPIERALREASDPPVIARISDEAILLDARTISTDEVPVAARGLARTLLRIQEMVSSGSLRPGPGREGSNVEHMSGVDGVGDHLGDPDG